jgi:glycosyltransferase involved in cell wall biosynthesis
MHIWFISKYASIPSYARVPSRLFYLAREIAKKDNQVSLITSDANHFSAFPETAQIYNKELIDRVDITWIKTYKYKKTASIRRILSWLDFELKLFGLKSPTKNKPDVIIVSSLSIFTIFYGCYLKRKFKSILVFEVRDIWPLTMTEEASFSKWHPLVLLIGFIEKFAYKKADLIVGTMPKLDEHVKQVLGYERPFFCSPIGFDSASYETNLATQNPFRKFAPAGKVIVGYAGSMGISNALDLFIDTIKLLRGNSGIHFLLIGSGDLKEMFITRLEGCSNVTFMDRISQSDIKYFLDACDILYLSTHPSKVWNYGQSMNKFVEYMLAGKPIIATYSGYQSMLNEAKCGLFVSSHQAEDLRAAIEDIASLSREELIGIGENGRRWIWANRKYSDLAKEYLNAIESIKEHSGK